MWTTVESMFEPELTDSTTSRNWIYVRRNVREEQRTDEVTGETVTVYIFEEMKVPRDEWELYKAVERNTANIDYIAMMSDLDIDPETEEDEVSINE